MNKIYSIFQIINVFVKVNIVHFLFLLFLIHLLTVQSQVLISHFEHHFVLQSHHQVIHILLRVSLNGQVVEGVSHYVRIHVDIVVGLLELGQLLVQSVDVHVVGLVYQHRTYILG